MQAETLGRAAHSNQSQTAHMSRVALLCGAGAQQFEREVKGAAAFFKGAPFEFECFEARGFDLARLRKMDGALVQEQVQAPLYERCDKLAPSALLAGKLSAIVRVQGRILVGIDAKETAARLFAPQALWQEALQPFLSLVCDLYYICGLEPDYEALRLHLEVRG